MPELILKEEVYRIVGAAMDVWYTLGRGFLEPVYQEALQIELGRRDIPSSFRVCLFFVREISWIVHWVKQGTIHESTRNTKRNHAKQR